MGINWSKPEVNPAASSLYSNFTSNLISSHWWSYRHFAGQIGNAYDGGVQLAAKLDKYSITNNQQFRVLDGESRVLSGNRHLSSLTIIGKELPL